MRFAAPAGLFFLVLAVPVLLLHVLRPRRQTMLVSSTYLWRELAHPVSAASPWQRLRPSLLLLLQLLAVVLLAASVARPVRQTAAPLSRHTVFILDASGSMAATDGRPDRLADARAAARRLRAELPAGGLASLVVASADPRVALSASPDPGAFADALSTVRQGSGKVDFPGAFNLAESLETPDAPVGFVLLSDGGLDGVARRLLPPGTRYQKIGSRSENRTVSRLTVEVVPKGLRAIVSMRNTGGPASTQRLRLDVDGRTVERLEVRLGAGELVEREVDLPSGSEVEAFLEGEDLLPADNRAFATASERRQLRVLLSGPQDVFLERLLGAIPGLDLHLSDTSRTAEGFDLAIYDRVAVPADPGGPFLAIAPPAGAPAIKVTGEVAHPAVTLVRSDAEVLEGLDLSTVGIAKAQRLQPVASDEVLVASEETPLLVRGSREGRGFFYLGFALEDSNLPLQVTFPVLIDRLLGALAGTPPEPADLRTGDRIPLPDRGEAATVVAPGGAEVGVAPGGPGPVATRPGFYRVRRPERPETVLAVNVSSSESVLAPVQTLPVRPRPPLPGERPPAGERSLLVPLVLGLLVVLTAELVLSRRARGVPRRQWRVATAVRSIVVACLLGALLGLALPRRGTEVTTIFAVDASDSMGPAGRENALAWVEEALAGMPNGSGAGVTVFGGDTRVELTVRQRARLSGPLVSVDSSRTNLAGALRLAGALAPASSRRRVVVVSDGRSTEGDVAAESRRLRAAGVAVDVHTVEVAGGFDAAVARLTAPVRARRGDKITLAATIASTEERQARLTLRSGDRVVEERTVGLRAGETAVEFTQPVPEPGLARFRLDVSAAGDAVPENDVAYVGVQVEGPARVLVVEGSEGVAGALAGALRASGMEVSVVPAVRIPSLDELATYASTVLVDVDLRDLATEQVAAVASAARDLGRGLVTVGGSHSYALGGYRDSELERLLPVVSDVLDPKRRQSVAEVLAIDSSGSMAACHCREEPGGGLAGGGNFRGGATISEGGVNKTDISRSAAARAVRALAEDDQVGILAFNTEQRFIVPLQTLPTEQVVTEGLRGLKPEGGTNLRRPLLVAAEALRRAKARLKHIVLFTDGFTDEAGLDELATQAAALAAEGITTSVLATGEGAAEQLRKVADAGRGRFYPGRDLYEIPELLAQEVAIASRDYIVEGEFRPKVVGVGPVTANLTESPALLGYVATTAKPTAETLLEIGDSADPLLASWRVGLGRATSWTSDASQRWSQLWARWGGYQPFWSDVVKDTFPSSDGTLGIRVELDGERLTVRAESERPFPEGSTGVARIVVPDGRTREIRLERTSGTVFAGEIESSAAGSYAVGVTVTGPGSSEAAEPIASAIGLASQSYSPEYRPGVSDGAGLARISRLAGGRGEILPAAAFDASGLSPGRSRVPLAGWLLAAAAALWPIDVALRRISLGSSPLATALHAGGSAARRLPGTLFRRRRSAAQAPVRVRSPGPRGGGAPAPGRRRRSPGPPAPPPTLGRLLERKRRDHGADPAEPAGDDE